MKIIVLGSPRTKKTSNQAVLQKSASGKGQRCPYCRKPIAQRVFPSAAWREWLKTATLFADDGQLVEAQGAGLVRMPSPHYRGEHLETAQPWKPIAEPVNARAIFYRAHEGPGDLVGFLQGLTDLLEERGVLENDRWVRGFDGSRLTTTNGRPRVEVELTPLSSGPVDRFNQVVSYGS